MPDFTIPDFEDAAQEDERLDKLIDEKAKELFAWASKQDDDPIVDHLLKKLLRNYAVGLARLTSMLYPLPPEITTIVLEATFCLGIIGYRALEQEANTLERMWGK